MSRACSSLIFDNLVMSRNLFQLGWVCSSLMFHSVVMSSYLFQMGWACSSLMVSSQQSDPDVKSSTEVTDGLVVRQQKSLTGL